VTARDDVGLQIVVRRNGRATPLTAEGELDVSSAPLLGEVVAAVCASRPERVEVDLGPR
jgi:hypothetical protein